MCVHEYMRVALTCVFVRVRPHVAINDHVCASEYVHIVGCIHFKFLGTCEVSVDVRVRTCVLATIH